MLPLIAFVFIEEIFLQMDLAAANLSSHLKDFDIGPQRLMFPSIFCSSLSNHFVEITLFAFKFFWYYNCIAQSDINEKDMLSEMKQKIGKG